MTCDEQVVETTCSSSWVPVVEHDQYIVRSHNRRTTLERGRNISWLARHSNERVRCRRIGTNPIAGELTALAGGRVNVDASRRIINGHRRLLHLMVAVNDRPLEHVPRPGTKTANLFEMVAGTMIATRMKMRRIVGVGDDNVVGETQRQRHVRKEPCDLSTPLMVADSVKRFTRVLGRS